MQKLLLFIVLLLPFVAFAQDNTAAKQHQNAVLQLQRQLPNAQEVDVLQRQELQKDAHKSATCGTCNKTTKATTTSPLSLNQQLADLRAKEQKLERAKQQLIANTTPLDDNDKLTLRKYVRSLVAVQAEIAKFEKAQKRTSK